MVNMDISFTYLVDSKAAPWVFRLAEEATDLRFNLIKARQRLKDHPDAMLSLQSYHMAEYMKCLDQRLRDACVDVFEDPGEREKIIGHARDEMREKLDDIWMDLKSYLPTFSASEWNNMLKAFMRIEGNKDDVQGGAPHAD